VREKELFDQLNLKFSSLQVNIGDFLQVIGNGSFWKKHAEYPGRKLEKGEMLLIIEKTQNEDWIVAVDSTGEIGEVCIRVFEKEE
jgi:hypothetical protein